MTPGANSGKRLRMVPSSASSQAQTGQMSPSKGIYLEQPTNAADTRGEQTIGNNSILEESIGKDGLKIKKRSSSSRRWDRNSKMPPQMMKRWFGGGPQTDNEVTILFK